MKFAFVGTAEHGPKAPPRASIRGEVWWDHSFLGLAAHIARWSKDPSTQVGSVIVRPNRTVASMGYNGFPRGTDDDPALYADREQKYAKIVHGELNAIITATESLKGYTLYSSLFPCDRCAAIIIQAGIARVVSPHPTPDQKSRWGKAFDNAMTYFGEAGVKVTMYHDQVEE